MLRQARSFVLISLFMLTTTRPLRGLALNFTKDTGLRLNASPNPQIVQIQTDSLVVSSTNVLSLSDNVQTLKEIQVSPTPTPSRSHLSISVSPTTDPKPPDNSAPSSPAVVLASPTTPLLLASTSSFVPQSKSLASVLGTAVTTLSFVTDFRGSINGPSPIATLSLNPTILSDGSSIQTPSSPSTNSEDVNASGASSSPDPGLITGKLPASMNHAGRNARTPRGSLHLGVYTLAGCALSLVL